MKQLTEEQIEQIESQVVGKAERINYKWMLETSGCFDITHEYLGNKFHMREFVYKGRIRHLVNKQWVEDPVHNQRLPDWLREPWGTYPNLPEKPNESI